MAIGIFAKNLADSKRTTSAGKYLRDFKPVLNTRYRVFLPQFQFDVDGKLVENVATITVGARQFSYKALGVFSYVFDSNEIRVRDDDSFDDLTELRDLERMASVLHRASFQAAVTAAENAAREEAQEAGVEINQDQLGLQRKALELKFFGDKDHDPDEKPVIGQALKYTYTIGVFVPMTTDGKPDFEKATIGIWQLSAKRQQKILDLYKTEAYEFTGKPYLEFSFDYSGSNPKEAGKDATFEFISEQLALETKYPLEWQNHGTKLIAQLPTGTPEDMANAIVAKCGILHNRHTISDIVSKFYGHISTMQTAVIALKKLDVEYLKKNKRIIQQIPILSKYPGVKQVIDELEDEAEDNAEIAAAVAEPATTPETPVAQEPQAPVEQQIKPEVNIQGAEGHVTFGGLNPNAVGTAGDEESLLGEI